MSLEPIGFRTTEAHEAIGCTPRAIKSALSKGELVSRRVGRRTIILADDLALWAKSRPIARRNKKDGYHA
jgi:hypothetical protein